MEEKEAVIKIEGSAKISATKEAKREIDILAASEKRHVYEVVNDMLKLYKAVSVGHSVLRIKKIKPVRIEDVIATH